MKRKFAVLLPLMAAIALAGTAVADEIEFNKKDCQRVLRAARSADVEYKPGVDARGRKVAPADLGGGSPIKIPDEISIDIGIDIGEKYGIGAGGKFTGESTIGKVTVKRGRVYWNGQPLDDPQQAAIAEACQRTYGK